MGCLSLVVLLLAKEIHVSQGPEGSPRTPEKCRACQYVGTVGPTIVSLTSVCLRAIFALVALGSSVCSLASALKNFHVFGAP